MLLNVKLNDTAKKMLWTEAVHMQKSVRNSMDNIGSTTSPFENFYGEKPKIIGLFLEFGCIGYVTKQEKFKKKTTEKHSMQPWWDMPKIIQGTCTSFTTHKPRESL